MNVFPPKGDPQLGLGGTPDISGNHNLPIELVMN
jgi:hypothetical protein